MWRRWRVDAGVVGLVVTLALVTSVRVHSAGGPTIPKVSDGPDPQLTAPQERDVWDGERPSWPKFGSYGARRLRPCPGTRDVFAFDCEGTRQGKSISARRVLP